MPQKQWIVESAGGQATSQAAEVAATPKKQWQAEVAPQAAPAPTALTMPARTTIAADTTSQRLLRNTLSALPTVGGMLGSVAGAAAGAPAGPAGMAAGGVGGSGIGQMSGEALRQLLSHSVYGTGPATTQEAADEIKREGVIGGLAELFGFGLAKGGGRLMRTAADHYAAALAPRGDAAKIYAEEVAQEMARRSVPPKTLRGLLGLADKEASTAGAGIQDELARLQQQSTRTTEALGPWPMPTEAAVGQPPTTFATRPSALEALLHQEPWPPSADIYGATTPQAARQVEFPFQNTGPQSQGALWTTGELDINATGGVPTRGFRVPSTPPTVEPSQAAIWAPGGSPVAGAKGPAPDVAMADDLALKRADASSIMKNLLKIRQEAYIKNTGVVGNESKLKNIDVHIGRLGDVIREQGRFLSPETLVSWRRILDEQVKHASEGFTKDLADASLAEANKRTSNVLRAELNNKYPDLAKVNAEFHFWNTVKDLSRARQVSEIGRKPQQAGEFMATRLLLAGGIGGGGYYGYQEGGTTGAVLGGLTGALGVRAAGKFVEFVQSPLYQTTSAHWRSLLGRALARHDSQEVLKLIARASASTGTQPAEPTRTQPATRQPTPAPSR